MASCILYQNDDATISIVDIPRSIELAQGVALGQRRLLSSEPIKEPFPSTEPKSLKARDRLGGQSLDDLLLSKHLQFALDEVKASYKGAWCLTRALSFPADEETNDKKRRRASVELGAAADRSFAEDIGDQVVKTSLSLGEGSLYQNSSNESVLFHEDLTRRRGTLPPNSTLIYGDISTTKSMLVSTAPKFNLIIMDPPWPNRSARRKKSYFISHGNNEIKTLLSSLPIENKLAEQGIVAVWITNREAFRDMLLRPGGLFEEWGITLVGEWIWLKTTVKGEPICSIDSVWRKPYEILLVGRRGIKLPAKVTRRVLIAVPDIHSRKPNLKILFDRFLGREKYDALEIFARNIAAGWWAWGNEVLKFQMNEHWVKNEDD